MRKQIVKLLNKFGLRVYAKSLLRSINYSKSIKVNGVTFKTLKLYGSVCLVSESWMPEILKNIFSVKEGAFLDIGVNLGQTLIEVKSIDLEKKYVGFEPNPSCVFYVEELVKKNRLKNVKIIPVGLWKSDSILTMDLYSDDITNSGGSVIENFWEYKNQSSKRKLYVPVLQFSTVSKSVQLPDFGIIKIDVEGAELDVLETLSDVILATKPIIIIEILSAYSEENTLRFERLKLIDSLIKNIDYKILRIIEENDESLKNILKINTLDIPDDPNNCNYILYHITDEDKIDETFKSYLKPTLLIKS